MGMEFVIANNLALEPANTSGANPSDDSPRGIAALRHQVDHDESNGASLVELLVHYKRSVEIWQGGLRGSA